MFYYTVIKNHAIVAFPQLPVFFTNNYDLSCATKEQPSMIRQPLLMLQALKATCFQFN